jgi:light-regulated signal transduction histidine kinase (bacteriophytochrome)
MSEIKHDTNELSQSSLDNYSLVEIMHHMVGNELAVISGYTQLLLREVAAQEKETSLLDLERLAQRNEKRLSYLQAMKQSEEHLNNFLFQLRGCSLATTKRSFNEQLVKTDLVPLCKQIIEKLAPLYKDCPLQTQLPVQSLYVMCNHLWITLALETIVNHTIAARMASTPVVIGVEECTDLSNDLQKARIGIHITRGSMEHKSGTEEIFEMWSQMRDERGQDVCMALCGGIFREHGGCLWREQEAEHREVVYAALPLVK